MWSHSITQGVRGGRSWSRPLSSPSSQNPFFWFLSSLFSPRKPNDLWLHKIKSKHPPALKCSNNSSAMRRESISSSTLTGSMSTPSPLYHLTEFRPVLLIHLPSPMVESHLGSPILTCRSSTLAPESMSDQSSVTSPWGIGLQPFIHLLRSTFHFPPKPSSVPLLTIILVLKKLKNIYIMYFYVCMFISISPIRAEQGLLVLCAPSYPRCL